jgi:hypothetical protein
MKHAQSRSVCVTSCYELTAICPRLIEVFEGLVQVGLPTAYNGWYVF